MSINYRKQLKINITLCLCAISMLTVTSFAQTAQAAHPLQEQNAPDELNFEAASIRKSPAEMHLKNADLLDTHQDLQPQNGLFSANDYTSQYIIFAYNISDVSLIIETMRSLPAWANQSKWEIDARSDHTPTRDELRQMMRSLLRERFKLQVHYEDRHLPAYALVRIRQDQLGPGIQPHPANIPCTASNALHTPGTSNAKDCGTRAWVQDGYAHLRVTAGTLDQFAAYLSSEGFMNKLRNGGAFINRTGLDGQYDISLDYILPPPDESDPSSLNYPSGQTIEEALKKQLGLKLIKDTAPVHTLLVDHIEQPSAN